MIFYDPLYFMKCDCALCLKIRELTDKGNVMILQGGWADPRRHYLESEEDFLERIPDGFIRWPEDHDPLPPKPEVFMGVYNE